MTAPTPGAAALTLAAARRWRSLTDLSAQARPACPTCGGVGWVTSRSAVPFIGGLSAVACGCTGEQV
jgi:hypothetical protein